MTTTETPAALLRRAAKLMRERAEAAPEGPWWTGSSPYTGYPKFVRNERSPFVLGEYQEGWAWPAIGDYIASWYPLVALALAGWLEDVAREADDLIKEDAPGTWGCDRCGEYLAPGACTCWDKALAVARAYLGEPDGI